MLDAPPEPVIGLAKGEIRWRGMTVLDYGGGGAVIGLRCASAATVEVPIGPFSS